ncbi:MAG: MBL fold metallo-hydrolase [Chloroflexi bacterium]|nr:MBL fold metallo-hydrolase [Chloroflexota bacterium]
MSDGTISVKLLSDGIIKFDGGALFGQVPKALWERSVEADRYNRVKLGLNCLLIQTQGQNLLVETGCGTKEPKKVKDIYSLGTSRLLRELKEHGLSPKEVHGVILTHLHFDHAGGCTRLDRSGTPVPTFPKATYYVQRAAWEEATSPNERARASYHPDDFLPLQEHAKLKLLDGDQQIAPGVWVKETAGHTRGHQIVVINNGGDRVVFLGDLVPTPMHLNLPYIAAFDYSPEDTLAKKRDLLQRAEREGWLLVFPHGEEERAGYLENVGGKRHLRPVQLE